jgi:hypothetical protein
LSASSLVELLPEHTTPELVYLESKWSSFVSCDLTVKALRDFLPVDAELHATSVRRHTLRIAKRCEADLHTQDETVTRRLCRATEAPVDVGIDGGYFRHWEHKHTYRGHLRQGRPDWR